MRVDWNGAGKGTSSMDGFGSLIDIVNMKLGSKFINSSRIKTLLLKRPQRVIVEDGATQSQKDGVEGTEAPWRMEQRTLCCSCALKLLHQRLRKYQWGSGGLHAWPETGSWWKQIIVLEFRLWNDYWQAKISQYGVLDSCRQAGSSLARCLRFICIFWRAR